MTATAPTDGPNPVYSAWVTFTAVSGATVYIDRVAIGAAMPKPRRASGRIGLS